MCYTEDGWMAVTLGILQGYNYIQNRKEKENEVVVNTVSHEDCPQHRGTDYCLSTVDCLILQMTDAAM